MQTFKTFDIVGPRMIGPSSSHTAGAARLAYVAWRIAGEDVQRAELTLYGSFAQTGKGHGTDKALLAGVLGLHPDDERLRYSRLLAQEAGVEYTIRFVGDPPTHYDYANMARIRIESHDGRITDVLGGLHRRRKHPHHRDQRPGSGIHRGISHPHRPPQRPARRHLPGDRRIGGRGHQCGGHEGISPFPGPGRLYDHRDRYPCGPPRPGGGFRLQRQHPGHPGH